ncbi:MAG TPA: MBL fold metallo-hydrolase [Vicinamibacterales bacterium]|nr:MBL fold metallo-hydrolase [Vicinamibacterales bacterium]
MTAGRVTMLGTGTSHGVPMIGCNCATCRSTDPRDRRLRPSIYLDVPGFAHILVDAATDLRQQALRHDISHVDAVLFTHAHADHILGLDDLRSFNALQGTAIPCYANRQAWETIRRQFDYVFEGPLQMGGGVPQLTTNEVRDPFFVRGVRIVPVPLWHGRLPILGFRFGSFAYLTDCNRIPDESWALVDGVDTLILDALRDEPHETHFTLGEAVAVVEQIAPRRAYFTHMTHDLPHAKTNARLPAGIELAYDGLVLDIEVDVA